MRKLALLLLLFAQSALAAFPVVESVTQSSEIVATTTHTVDYPAVVESGDLLLIFFACETTACDPTTPTGYTEVETSVGNGTGDGRIWALTADGTEDGGSASVTTAGSAESAAQVYRITAWGGTVSTDLSCLNHTEATSAAPDPPATTTVPAGDNLFIAAALYFDDGGTITAYPTNYTNGVQTNSSGTANTTASVATARRELAETSDDPGAFMIDEIEGWGAHACVVEPGTSGGAAAPTFTVNPTLNVATDTGATFDYTADGVDTLYAMFTDTAAVAPTCDAIELTTGSHGAANEATTGSADSILITSTDSPEAQFYDAHFCIEDAAANDSAVVTVADVQLSAPTGFQFVTATSIGVGSPCADFNAAVVPDMVANDYLLAPVNLSGGDFGTHDGAANAATLSDSTQAWTASQFVGYELRNVTDGSECAITANTATTATCTLAGGTDNDWDASDSYEILPLDISAACQFSYDDGGEGAQQRAFNIGVYDLSVGDYHAEDIDFIDHNNAPVCQNGSTQVLTLNVAINTFDLDNQCTDADAEQLSYTVTVGVLPTGLSLGGTGNSELTGTPTVEDENGETVTFTGTDIGGVTDTFDILFYPIETINLGDYTAGDLDAAITAHSAAFPWQDDLALIATFSCHETEAANQVISQDPVATTEVTAFQEVTVVVSTGLCGRGRPVKAVMPGVRM